MVPPVCTVLYMGSVAVRDSVPESQHRLKDPGVTAVSEFLSVLCSRVNEGLLEQKPGQLGSTRLGDSGWLCESARDGFRDNRKEQSAGTKQLK